MTKMIHSMIRVLDLEASVRFYCQALELEVADQYMFDDFSLTYLANQHTGFELELTHNRGKSDAYKHGNAYGHLAVSVEDIRKTHSRLASIGIEGTEIKTFHHQGKPLATFFFISDPDGYKIEFIQRAGRFE